MVPGSHCTQLYGLTPLTQGFSKSYKDNIDPRVTNEFAAAAFRIGHTLIPDILKTFNTVSRYGTLHWIDVIIPKCRKIQFL